MTAYSTFDINTNRKYFANIMSLFTLGSSVGLTIQEATLYSILTDQSTKQKTKKTEWGRLNISPYKASQPAKV